LVVRSGLIVWLGPTAGRLPLGLPVSHGLLELAARLAGLVRLGAGGDQFQIRLQILQQRGIGALLDMDICQD